MTLLYATGPAALPVHFALFGRLTVTVAGQRHLPAPSTAAVLARLLLAEGRVVTVVELYQAMHPTWTGALRRDQRVAVQKRIAELRKLLNPTYQDSAANILLTERGVATAYRLVVARTQVDVLWFEDLIERAGHAEPGPAAELRRTAMELWVDQPLLDMGDRDFVAEAVVRLQRLRDEHLQEPAPGGPPAGSASDRSRTPVPLPVPRQPLVPPLIPRQLPASMPYFVGRQAELRALTQHAGRARKPGTGAVVAAISGTAGVGKSTLAVHWAQMVADQFPDGQLYVDLRGFGADEPMRPAQAICAFLGALGVAAQHLPPGLTAQMNMYRTLLAGRRVLILLDNARDADQVRPLLPAAPGCLALVTSRQQLASLVVIEGAHSINLELLAPAEGRRLLLARLDVQRARSEPEAVDEIVSRCVGLPLALALVAARVAAKPRFSLTALAARLHEAGGVLDVSPTADTTTSLGAAFSWSYGCLSSAAARVFRLLGLHPGADFTARSAASLAALPPVRMRALLAELAAGHLIAEYVPGRYRFHELLRAYAADLAGTTDAEGVRAAAQRRILDHYLCTACLAARRLRPRRVEVAAPVPEVTPEELPDPHAALAWFGAEHRALVAAVGTAARVGLDTHAWQLTWAMADFFDWRGHWHDWAQAARAALAVTCRTGNLRGQAHLHHQLGVAHTRLASYAAAHSHFAQALAGFTQLGDRLATARTRQVLAWLLDRQGRHEEAIAQGEQALRVHEAEHDLAGQAAALNVIGWGNARLGRCQQALGYCEAALRLHQGINDGNGKALALGSVGYTRHQLGEYAEAARCYHQALTLFRQLGNRYSAARVLHGLGQTHRAVGEYDCARSVWRQALAIFDELGDPESQQVRTQLDVLDTLTRPSPAPVLHLTTTNSPQELARPAAPEPH